MCPDLRRFLNFKLDDIKVLDPGRYPHMVRCLADIRALCARPLSVGRLCAMCIFPPPLSTRSYWRMRRDEVCPHSICTPSLTVQRQRRSNVAKKEAYVHAVSYRTT